jgi:hypothetical protein
MIREELKQLKTEPRDLRKFGLVVGGVFALLALWFWWRGKLFYPYLAAPAVALMFLGLVWPRALKHVYIGWMAMAFVLGTVVSTVLLTVFYFVVVTPVGLIARAVGQDFLSLRIQREARSYWLPRAGTGPKQRQEYERQY